MNDKQELCPKEKAYSLVIIDLWDDKNSAYKILETDELPQTTEEIMKTLNVGEYLMIYDKNGMTVNS